MLIKLAALLWLLAAANASRGLLTTRRSLEVVAEWRTVDYEYPNRVTRESAILTGDFIPNNVVVLDVDAYTEGKQQRIFVTTPRLKPGVPATLSELSVDQSGVAPKLRPFPSWAWNDQGDCDNLISVFRTTTDQCGRLWVLDSGTVNVFSGAERLCPPKLVVFDLRGNDGAELVTRYTFPSSQREPTSLAITVAVDVRGSDPVSCREAFAYVADVTEPAILVYDMRRKRSWRVLSNLFYPYPLHGNFQVNGVEFDLMDGVFGLALGPQHGSDRKLYFHSLASVRESWVSCRVLRNESNFGAEPDPTVGRQFHVSEPRRTSQSAAEAIDANGVLFFSLLSENALACWNTRLPYTPQNIYTVAKDDKTMQFASGLKVIGRYVWMLSSRFQNVVAGRMNPEEVNYRVLVAAIPELVRGTPCAVPGGPLDNLLDVDDHHPRPSPSGPLFGFGSSSFGPPSLPFGSTVASSGSYGPHPTGGIPPAGFSHAQGLHSTQHPSSYHEQQQGHSGPSGPSGHSGTGSGPSGHSGLSGHSGPSGSGSDAIVFREPVDRF